MLDVLRGISMTWNESSGTYTRGYTKDAKTFVQIAKTHGGWSLDDEYSREDVKDLFRESKSKTTTRIISPPRKDD